jgi:hypothetical protein
MLRLIASHRRASAAAAAASDDTLAMDLRFALDPGARRARLTPTMGEVPEAEPFAARELTPEDLDRLIFDLEVLREGLRFADDDRGG